MLSLPVDFLGKEVLVNFLLGYVLIACLDLFTAPVLEVQPRGEVFVQILDGTLQGNYLLV